MLSFIRSFSLLKKVGLTRKISKAKSSTFYISSSRSYKILEYSDDKMNELENKDFNIYLMKSAKRKRTKSYQTNNELIKESLKIGKKEDVISKTLSKFPGNKLSSQLSMTSEIETYFHEAKCGILEIKAQNDAIVGVEFVSKRIGSNQKVKNPIISQCCKELDEYFDNKRTKFDVKIDMKGTAFQLKVWSALLEIPYGKTITYSQLAEMVGNPKASRAVGNANGKNPISIIVPCHRVIASNGTLGGYSSGLERKKLLLDLEQNNEILV